MLLIKSVFYLFLFIRSYLSQGFAVICPIARLIVKKVAYVLMNRPDKPSSICVCAQNYRVKNNRNFVCASKHYITFTSLSSSISNMTFLLEFSATDMGAKPFVCASLIC